MSLKNDIVRLAHEKPELRGHLLPLLKRAFGSPEAKRLLERYSEDPSLERRADLSEYGIKTFREKASKMGYDHSDMMVILKEEAKRIRGLSPNVAGLQKYLKMSRVGSQYRLDRAVRSAIFCQLVGKGFIK